MAAQAAPVLTVAETASIMRVSKMTIYRMVQSGHLPSIRSGPSGRSFRIPEAAVHEYLRKSFTQAPASPPQ
ncbi:helix-turn-helix domain-containing protein [Streptomyces sp. NPDC006333]|uniref:helix-turn-helix domain-containing protein n=1 Tax=Streptomyces sp. NPDC006333 TaxID=3156753 RepID=UPI0033BD9A94